MTGDGGHLRAADREGADGVLGDFSDEDLMAEVAAGSRAAFAVLTRRHLRRGLRVAGRIVGPHDAEEVVQDAFVQVWEHAGRWRGDGARFTTWLYRIVVNRSLDYKRRRTFTPIEAAAEVPADGPGAEELAEEKQLASCVDAAIADLPERQRAALSLCYYEGLSCAEAAGVLRVSVSAMESLLVRARRLVRARLMPLIGNGEGNGS